MAQHGQNSSADTQHSSSAEVSPEHIANALKSVSMRFDAARHAVVLAVAVLAARGAWGPEPGGLTKLAMLVLLISALLGVLHFWWVARLASGVAAAGRGQPDPALPRAMALVDGFGYCQMIPLILGLLGLGIAFVFG